MLADLALINGNVITLDADKPRAEAVAIRDNTIVCVGTNAEVSRFVGRATRIVKLGGKTVVPGFIDTHIHVSDYGRLVNWIDLSSVGSIEQIQTSLRKRVERTPKGKWVLGHGLDLSWFSEKGSPMRFDLDVVSPENPVVFYCNRGQFSVVNSKALELAAVTRETKSPLEGIIEKDPKTGEPTGVLRGSARDLVWVAVPKLTDEELLEATYLAVERILEAGITGIHWMISSPQELWIVKKLREKKLLPRIYSVVSFGLLGSLMDPNGWRSSQTDSFKIGAVEVLVDGYLSSLTAALQEPYRDLSSTTGILFCTQEELSAAISEVLGAGFQLVLHAVGDKALDVALKAVEQTSTNVTGKVVPTRIEQGAVFNKQLINRLKEQTVVVSVQPLVINSEFEVYSASERLGPERARLLYPIKTLLANGIRICAGSDCPMEPLSPLLGIEALVTRKYFPEERVSVCEALRMYTIDAAFSSGEGNNRGSIEVGKLADLTVLSHDPHVVAQCEIGDISVEMTIVGGRVVYSAC